MVSSQLVQETPKQPNDMMKKPVIANPFAFKRPFSQNVPTRLENQAANQASNSQAIIEPIKEVSQAQQSKTSDQAFPQTQKIPMSNILSRIEQLDEWQKEKLIEILNNLENFTSNSATN